MTVVEEARMKEINHFTKAMLLKMEEALAKEPTYSLKPWETQSRSELTSGLLQEIDEWKQRVWEIEHNLDKYSIKEDSERPITRGDIPLVIAEMQELLDIGNRTLFKYIKLHNILQELDK